MSEKRLTVSARVVLVLEIDSGSTWGQSVTMEQVLKQAGEETKGAIAELIRTRSEKFGGCRLVSDPVVKSVSATLT